MLDRLESTGVQAEIPVDTRQITFHDFVREAWHVVEPHTEFLDNWHIQAIGVLLERVESGDITRAVVNLPPRHMKSLLVSVMWPCWLWTRKPGTRFIFGSYSDKLSKKHSIDRRTIIESEWYQTHWGHVVQLTHDTNRQDEFVNTSRGHMIATSVGGTITGKGADIIVIDDPHNPKTAESDAERNEALKWFDDTIGNRLDNQNGKIVVVMQRLHENDVAGRAVKVLKYHRFKIPAIEERPKEGEEQQLYDMPGGSKVRRKIGTVLWPKRFGRAFLEERRIAQGDEGFSKQYQQEPTGKSGTVFNVDAIRDWQGPMPGMDEYERRVIARTRGWDTAATADGGDYTAGIRLALLNDGSVVIEDVIRAQLDPDAVEDVIVAGAIMDAQATTHGAYSVREEQEPGSSGKTVVRFRAKKIPPGIDYRSVTVDKKKTTRALPFSSAIRMGRVFAIKQAEWWAGYKEELRLFPNGVFDDRVDGTSCAYNHLGLNVGNGSVEQKVGA